MNLRTSSGEGLYYLCQDDVLTTIASQTTNAVVTKLVQGDAELSRTIWTVAKVSY